MQVNFKWILPHIFTYCQFVSQKLSKHYFPKKIVLHLILRSMQFKSDFWVDQFVRLLRWSVEFGILMKEKQKQG